MVANIKLFIVLFYINIFLFICIDFNQSHLIGCDCSSFIRTNNLCWTQGFNGRKLFYNSLLFCHLFNTNGECCSDWNWQNFWDWRKYHWNAKHNDWKCIFFQNQAIAKGDCNQYTGNNSDKSADFFNLHLKRSQRFFCLIKSACNLAKLCVHAGENNNCFSSAVYNACAWK